MNSAFALLILVVILALVFDFINGFHDTANAIATVVATRVLAPWQAIGMAASLNFLGAISGTAVAQTIGKGLVPPEIITQSAVAAALVGAIIWNLLTWYYGIPSSSSHALVGGILGAAIAQAGVGAPTWETVAQKVVVPFIVSPIAGFLFAGALMVLCVRAVYRFRPGFVSALFGRLQLLSSAFMAFSHGSNDAQKTMGVITLALFSYGAIDVFEVPTEVIFVSALAMGLGTAMGGWRIIRTMGTKLAELWPIHGFAAETGAGIIIETASRLGFPLSTTHVISSSILGVGSTRGVRGVRWHVAGAIVTAWIITIPACAIFAAITYWVLHNLGV